LSPCKLKRKEPTARERHWGKKEEEKEKAKKLTCIKAYESYIYFLGASRKEEAEGHWGTVSGDWLRSRVKRLREKNGGGRGERDIEELWVNDG